MKKSIIVILAILLVSCGTPQASENTQIPPTPTTSILSTPLAAMDTPGTIVSTQQPGTLDIWRLQMIDANIGWAEGADSSAVYLLRTTDGGETWQDVTPPTQYVPSDANGAYGAGMSALDADTAWAVSAGYPFSNTPPYTVVWHTTDGGQSWSPSNPISTISGSPQSEFSPWLQFVDEKHGWLTLHFQQRNQSLDLRYRTSDGGITWDAISGCAHYDGVNGMCPVPQFTDENIGWEFNGLPLYGEVDPLTLWQVQRTLDGGKNWENIALPPAQEQTTGCNQDIVPVAKGIVGIRLDCADASGQIQSYYYLSGDQGQTWKVHHLPGKVFSILSAVNFYEAFGPDVSTTGNVFFLDLMTGWRLSALDNSYQLERTTDGGATWQTMSDHLDWKEGFQFVDVNTGWQVTSPWEVAGDSRMQLLRTRDGGKTWEEIKPVIGNQ